MNTPFLFLFLSLFVFMCKFDLSISDKFSYSCTKNSHSFIEDTFKFKFSSENIYPFLIRCNIESIILSNNKIVKNQRHFDSLALHTISLSEFYCEKILKEKSYLIQITLTSIDNEEISEIKVFNPIISSDNYVCERLESVLTNEIKSEITQSGNKLNKNKRYLQMTTTAELLNLTGSANIRDMIVDSLDNLYIVGTTNVSINSQPIGGSNDAFLIKKNPLGTTIWTKLYGFAGDDQGCTICLDQYQNPWIMGNSNQAIPPHAYVGGRDIFIYKINPTDGTILNSYAFGSTGDEYPKKCALDTANNFYGIGFGYGSINGATYSGAADPFFFKIITSTMTVSWVKMWGNGSNDDFGALKIDYNGDIIIGGYCDGNCLGLGNAGSSDGYLRKFDSSGNLLWQKWAVPTPGNDNISSIDIDSNNSIYCAITVNSTLNGVSVPGGSQSAALVKYDSQGNHVFTKIWGSSNSEDHCYYLKVDNKGQVHVVGIILTGGTWTKLNLSVNNVVGSSDIFYVVYNLNGQNISEELFMQNGDNRANVVQVSSTGKVIIGGYTDNTFLGVSTAATTSALLIYKSPDCSISSQIVINNICLICGNQKFVKIGNTLKNLCLSSCPFGYILQTLNNFPTCVFNCLTNQVYEDGFCLNKCYKPGYKVNSLRICEPCTDQYNGGPLLKYLDLSTNNCVNSLSCSNQLLIQNDYYICKCNPSDLLIDNICTTTSTCVNDYFYKNIYNICISCPDSADSEINGKNYMEENVCVKQCGSAYAINTLVTNKYYCEACGKTSKYLKNGICVSDCSGLIKYKGSNFLWQCVEKCPKGFIPNSNECTACQSNYYIDYNLGIYTCVAICPSIKLTNNVDLTCDECPLNSPYIYDSKCYSLCPNNTGIRNDPINCVQCLSSEIIMNNKCTTTPCDITKYVLINNNCIDCKSDQNGMTIFYNSQCINSCPSLMEYNNLNNTCIPKQLLICKTGEERVIENGKDVCRTCTYLGKFLENNICVPRCTSNSFDPNTNICIPTKCGKKTLKKPDSSYECVDFCDNFKGIYSDPNNNNYCMNCSLFNLNVENNKCTPYKEVDIMNVNGSNPNSENLCIPPKKYFVENTCYESCPQGYNSSIYNNIEVCRVIIKSPECNNSYCLNEGTCFVISIGDLNCKCKIDYFGKNCQLNNSLLKEERNSFESLLNNISKNNNIETQEANYIAKLSKDVPELFDSISITNVITIGKKKLSTTTTNNNNLIPIDSALNAKLNTNSTLPQSELDILRNEIISYSKLAIKDIKNITQFMNGNKNPILYNGDILKINIQSLDANSLQNSRENRLPIIDYLECEKILKEKNIISNEEKLYSLNVMYKHGVFNEIPKNVVSQSLEILPQIVDSTGNIIDTSLCKNIKIKTPINSNIVNGDLYEEILNTKGFDIFNKSDPMFKDKCIPFQYDNETDYSLSYRNKEFNTTSECSGNGTYKGLDEFHYTICEYDKVPDFSSANFKESILDNIKNSNFRLYLCYKQTFNKFTKNIAFWIFGSLFLVSVIGSLLHYFIFDIKSNISNIEHNDVVTLTPDVVGAFNNKNVLSSSKILDKNNNNITNFKSNFRQIKNLSFNNKNITHISQFSNIPISVGNNNGNNFNISNNNHSLGDSINVENHNDNFSSNGVIYGTNNFINSNEKEKIKISKKDEENAKDINQLENKNELKIKTDADLDALPIFLRISFDESSFLEFFWKTLKHKHEILNLIFVKSIVEPFIIRVLKLFFMISIEFTLNAMFYTESILNNQTDLKRKGGKVTFISVFINEFSKSLWPALISIFLSIILSLIIRVPKDYLREFYSKMKTENDNEKFESM